MQLTKLFTEFFNSEKTGGLVLICATVISILLANSALQESYNSIFDFHFAGHTTTQWINDGLMTIFFLLIGLELEREIYVGELASMRRASLPAIAAVGGMLVPAAVHLCFTYGTPSQAGAGIPMATDIAFALGVLSLLGDRVSPSLKIFLTALAVIDDLGAILVIAFVYTSHIDWPALGFAFLVFAALLTLNRLKVHNLIPYLVGGVVMWYFMVHSGIHATITGVLLAFAIPFGDGGERSPSYALQHFLHKPVAFLILPLFALANTRIEVHAHSYLSLLHANSMGIAAGLIFGKPIGIVSFTYLASFTKLARLPDGLSFRHFLGAAFLGGIGFTMSIFITLLAFRDNTFIEQSKIAVMVSSLIAGGIGYGVLRKGKSSNELSESP